MIQKILSVPAFALSVIWMCPKGDLNVNVPRICLKLYSTQGLQRSIMYIKDGRHLYKFFCFNRH